MLPIRRYRELLVKTVEDNPVTIIVGETGSGKTTGIPQILYEEGFGTPGSIIGITEPRRIAAISVAQFVAGNVDARLGDAVAHKVRFDDETNDKTVMKFMTDGVLLREMLDDPLLSRYGVIIIDEAHERSANIDFLMGLLKRLLKSRKDKDLKLLITSATIDADKFSRYFGGAPILTIEGRQYDVEIIWSDSNPSAWVDIEDRVVLAVHHILDSSKSGDMLVFLTGYKEIELMTEALSHLLDLYDLVILPVHGSLTVEQQAEIFLTHEGKRKIVLATNIAEGSVTIDGIKYVIDTGFIKQTQFDTKYGIESLKIVQHSRAGCLQRSGRAGRTAPGTCYRLYSKENFLARQEFSQPEITRQSLAAVVLAMEALEIPDLRNFDFIDSPDPDAFREAYDTLKALGAMRSDGPGLSPTGRSMAELPLEPRVARMLIEADTHDCTEEIIIDASFLSVGRNVFVLPKYRESEAKRAHNRFKDVRSDMLTLLKIWKEFTAADNARQWCMDNFLAYSVLAEVRMVRLQLISILSRSGVEISTSDREEDILRSIAAGLAHNLLQQYPEDQHTYRALERGVQGIRLHPDSSLHRRPQHQWIVAVDIYDRDNPRAQTCSLVYDRWLPDIAPARFILGEPSLISYTPGDKSVVAQRALYLKDYPKERIGTVPAIVSLAQARIIQKRDIKRARAAGWVLSKIREVKGTKTIWTGTTVTGKTKVHNLQHVAGLADGSLWYCNLSQNKPKVCVLDLPPVAYASEKACA